MTLEQEFELKLIETYKVAAKHGYHATYFMQMLGERGGVGTAKKLLEDRDVQMGLYRLAQKGLLRVSVENLVLNPRYEGLFEEVERDNARRRLKDLKFEPGGWD